MWELASQIDGGDGQSPTEALAKELTGPLSGSVAGAVTTAALSTFGPAGMALAPFASAAAAGTISYITKQTIDNGYKEGFSNAGSAVTETFQDGWKETKNLAGGDRSLLGGGSDDTSGDGDEREGGDGEDKEDTKFGQSESSDDSHTTSSDRGPSPLTTYETDQSDDDDTEDNDDDSDAKDNTNDSEDEEN
jgi:hypothetical protein